MKNNYNTSPFKWAGSKAKVLPILLPILEKHRRKNFAEPFVGAGNVSMNFAAHQYYLNDINSDLIASLYGLINNPCKFIDDARTLFVNDGYEKFLENRTKFNSMDDIQKLLNPALFLYLNKHCFNGLCRYNSKGQFNVPIGKSISAPSVPETNIKTMAVVLQGRSELSSIEYEEFMTKMDLVDDLLIYCDPPYVPLTSNFKYSANDYTLEDHKKLKQLAVDSNHTVVLSNHWTEFTEELYSDATEIHTFDIQRTISRDGDERKKVKECIVVYKK
ncbi:DNA adenine methylase [Alishewanella phage vB_AspM_Slickus01]|nr:DNA adenine methylase [Alishewanella phage vB_AspM_Slickus01]